MRGYHGMSNNSNWYSWNPKKSVMQEGEFFEPRSVFEREYAIGWVGIDGDASVGFAREEEHGDLDIVDRIEKSKMDINNSTLNEEVKRERKNPLTAFSADEDKKLELAGDGTKIYMIFSTDCSAYQQWQSYNLFVSAVRVRQPGIITRIASGCTDEQKKSIEQWHDDHVRVISNRFKIIFTPKYSHIDGESGDYKYFNKPYGVKYWFEKSADFGWEESSGKLTKAIGNEVVILIDPDTLLLQPFKNDFSDVKFWNPFAKYTIERKKKVSPGTMFGQTYGLGTKWMQFVSLAGPNSPALGVDARDAQIQYQVGPPYIGVASDMYRVVKRWAELVRAVHKEKPQMLAEMYAYQLAAADQKLPHGVVDSMMISHSDTYGEAWDYIDALPDEEVCRIGASPIPYKYPLPTLLHYCQHYGVATVLFSKNRIPENFFSCQSHLLEEPPTDALSPNNAYRMDLNGKKLDLDKKQHKRHVFATCAITSAMNDAAHFFKMHHCNKLEANEK
jgi:hypothetical protein